MTWTISMISELTARWLRVERTAVIAKEMGVSKNTIIGKAIRINLPKRGSFSAKRCVSIKSSEIDMGDGISFFNLQPDMCKWPIGESPFKFCGAVRGENKSYCDYHAKIAYVKPRKT